MRIIKIRAVTTVDMELIVGDEYQTGPLSPTQRKHLRDQIERDTRTKSEHQAGVTVVEVAIKRAYVANA